MKLARSAALIVVSWLTSTIAWSHPLHDGAGLSSGFVHPFLGLDHLAAMIAVGVWAAQLGARAVWIVPAAFVATMIVGAVSGFAGMSVPYLEPLIAATVLALGLLVMFRAQLPVVYSAALVAAFALLHGAAHAAEMSPAQSLLAYGLGFALATALLHLGGIGVALAAKGREAALRLAAAPVALAGAWMLVSRMV
jgi:urease accessory protein